MTNLLISSSSEVLFAGSTWVSFATLLTVSFPVGAGRKDGEGVSVGWVNVMVVQLPRDRFESIWQDEMPE